MWWMSKCGRTLVIVLIDCLLGSMLVAAEHDPGGVDRHRREVRSDEPSMVFQSTGSTAVAREYPLAATLPNGQVLVAGGIDVHGTALTLCELYDPTSGMWTPTTSMAHGHGGGSCVVLPSGHVLVAGGDPNAEIFDPVSGLWRAAGTVNGQTVALCVLGDGEVLATLGGGVTMRWNEAAAIWSTAPAMPLAVFGNGLIALPDGGALAYGGYVSGDMVRDTAVCSRFDPQAGQWVSTSNMTIPRDGAQAVLSGPGTVLVIGGTDNTSGPLESCEAYDIASGTWTLLGNAPIPFGDGGCVTVLRSGLVLVTGGDQDGVVSDQAELYDPTAGIWSLTPIMLAAHVDHACVALPDGGALVIDGLTTGANGLQLSAACERYQVLVVNAPPSFVLGADVTVEENSPGLVLSDWVHSIHAGPLFNEMVTFQVQVDVPELFSVLPALDASGTLTCTVAPDVSGVATVTVIAHNSGGTADGGADTSGPQTFTISVAFINQPPSWVPGASLVVNEDSGGFVVPGWATSISPGPVNQSSETVSFSVSCNHPEYFSVQPQIAPDGTLSGTPASGRFGVTTVTAVLSNSGGTSNGGRDTASPVLFTIGLTRVIQQPSVAPVTMYDLVGYSVHAPVIISDPDALLTATSVPLYEVTGVCHLGQLSISSSGLASLTATAVGKETVSIQVTVGSVVMMSTLVVAVTDVAAVRPLIVSVPSVEWGEAGAPWVYDVMVSPASLAADADLVVSVQSDVPMLAPALSRKVSGNQFSITVPTLDPTEGDIQRLMVLAVDRTSQTVDIQIILLVIVGLSFVAYSQ